VPHDLFENVDDRRASQDGASTRASTVASFSGFQDAGGTLPRRMPFKMVSVNRFDNLLDDEDELLDRERSCTHHESIDYACAKYPMGRHVGYQSHLDVSAPSKRQARAHDRKSMSVTSFGSPGKKNRVTSLASSLASTVESSTRFSAVPLGNSRKSMAGSLGGTVLGGTVRGGSMKVPNHKRKRKLVISGVGVHETRKFEGVKGWCEGFGEIRQITRVPNGDLHIEFRSADVADTVCRLRAKVFISGVGSVYLSWTTGDKW